MTMARDKGIEAATREIRSGDRLDDQQASREGRAWPVRKSEKLIVPWKPVNAGGGKELHFQTKYRKGRRPGD
jgi:hypothetical protein